MHRSNSRPPTVVSSPMSTPSTSTMTANGQAPAVMQPPSASTTLPISDPSNPTTWPKRVSKACSSCRRDKIRCDGRRPCAGCIKKGLAPERCTDGCHSCRRAHARCDGSHPCSRCKEMNLQCVEEPTLTVLQFPDPIPAPVKVTRVGRGKTIDRAKLACQACRRDNKKCDDLRPCTRCQARQEECIHVTRGPKLVKIRCEACRRENKKCEDERPCHFCKENNQLCTNAPRKGRGHGTRVRAACLHCRRDKIQCGVERPCQGCVRRGYECLDRTCTCSNKGSGQCSVCLTQMRREGYVGSQHEEHNEESQPSAQSRVIPPPVSAQQINDLLTRQSRGNSRRLLPQQSQGSGGMPQLYTSVGYMHHGYPMDNAYPGAEFGHAMDVRHTPQHYSHAVSLNAFPPHHLPHVIPYPHPHLPIGPLGQSQMLCNPHDFRGPLMDASRQEYHPVNDSEFNGIDASPTTQ